MVRPLLALAPLLLQLLAWPTRAEAITTPYLGGGFGLGSVSVTGSDASATRPVFSAVGWPAGSTGGSMTLIPPNLGEIEPRVTVLGFEVHNTVAFHVEGALEADFFTVPVVLDVYSIRYEYGAPGDGGFTTFGEQAAFPGLLTLRRFLDGEIAIGGVVHPFAIEVEGCAGSGGDNFLDYCLYTDGFSQGRLTRGQAEFTWDADGVTVHGFLGKPQGAFVPDFELDVQEGGINYRVSVNGGSPFPATFALVPEPSSALLTGFGLAGLGAARRRWTTAPSRS
jgi:hypothetical protein